MKITILDASPRTGGTVSGLAAKTGEEATGLGADVETIRVQDLKVSACTGCMRCRSEHRCILPPDDSLRVLKALQESEGIIIAAPTYWGNMPGTLKLLFDRLVYGMMEDTPRFPKPLMRGKNAVIITACTTPWPFNRIFRQSSGTVRAIREILSYSGIKVKATLQRGGTAKHPDITDADISKSRLLARHLLRK